MIRDIVEVIRGGTTTLRELSQELHVDESALKKMLEYMLRKGIIRELHPECRPKGCRGCSHHGRCDSLPVTGYELSEKTQ